MAQQTQFPKTAAGREEFFISLYKKAFPVVARYIARLGGDMAQAQDIFQDALVVYYEKAASGQLDIRVNEKVYLMGIAKHLWSQAHKTGSKTEPLNDADFEAIADEQPAGNKLMHYLQTAGQKCMELLRAYYYDHLPVSDVAQQFGYKGERSATVAKYKCLEKVRDTIKQNSLTYADFIE